MSLLANSLVSRVLDHWYTADAADYGILALGIVVTGWFISRYYGE